MESNYHTEEIRARTPRSPKNIGVLSLAGMAQFTLGVDVVDGDDVRARYSISAAIPPETALQ